MIDIDMEEIGERIKYLRKEKHLTQIDLATKLGAAQNTISQYENGKAKISIDILVKLAQIFEISTDYILGLVEL